MPNLFTTSVFLCQTFSIQNPLPYQTFNPIKQSKKIVPPQKSWKKRRETDLLNYRTTDNSIMVKRMSISQKTDTDNLTTDYSLLSFKTTNSRAFCENRTLNKKIGKPFTSSVFLWQTFFHLQSSTISLILSNKCVKIIRSHKKRRERVNYFITVLQKNDNQTHQHFTKTRHSINAIHENESLRRANVNWA